MTDAGVKFRPVSLSDDVVPHFVCQKSLKDPVD